MRRPVRAGWLDVSGPVDDRRAWRFGQAVPPRRLIETRQYVLDSDWGKAQPRADAQNDYLAKHSWQEYARWHLGLTDETKTRYAFIYGDLRRLHRTGLIACVYRASEWRPKDNEPAAHDPLPPPDKANRLMAPRGKT